MRHLPHLLNRLRLRLFVDVGGEDATTFIAGMGRSGTTLVSHLVNHDYRYRVIFEPFRKEHVPVAAPFGPFAYIRPADRDPVRLRAIKTILAGRIPRGSVDRQHRGIVFRRRIVKAVRCNLVLGWLKSIRPAMPMILVIRSPFAVASSWSRLNWGMTDDGETLELDVILAHPELHEDFPEVERAMHYVDRTDGIQRIVAQWCILHLVALRQLSGVDVHIMHYEHLLLDPGTTVDRLATYVGEPIQGASRDRVLASATETDFLHRGNTADRRLLLNDWKNVLTPADVDQARRILARFGVEHLYDDEGLPTGAASRPWTAV
jgi:hypothetical protein